MIKWIRKQLGHEASPFVQFLKYAFVGGVATLTNMVVFFLLGWALLPCLTATDPFVRIFGIQISDTLSETTRAVNAAWCNTIGFIVSNTLCYLLNRAFVFKPGRHFWLVEFLLFFAGSGLSFVIGVSLQTGLIKILGIETTYAFAANIAVALLINYATRKFIIFKG